MTDKNQMCLLELLDSWYQDPRKGGKGEGKMPSEFDLREILSGILVELEHTSDHNEALAIVLDHLTESGTYYTDLKKVHKEESIFCDFYGIPVP